MSHDNLYHNKTMELLKLIEEVEKSNISTYSVVRRHLIDMYKNGFKEGYEEGRDYGICEGKGII